MLLLFNDFLEELIDSLLFVVSVVGGLGIASKLGVSNKDNPSAFCSWFFDSLTLLAWTLCFSIGSWGIIGSANLSRELRDGSSTFLLISSFDGSRNKFLLIADSEEDNDYLINHQCQSKYKLLRLNFPLGSHLRIGDRFWIRWAFTIISYWDR